MFVPFRDLAEQNMPLAALCLLLPTHALPTPSIFNLGPSLTCAKVIMCTPWSLTKKRVIQFGKEKAGICLLRFLSSLKHIRTNDTTTHISNTHFCMQILHLSRTLHPSALVSHLAKPASLESLPSNIEPHSRFPLHLLSSHQSSCPRTSASI